MPAYLDPKTKRWRAKFKIKNWEGEEKWVSKRGFRTKKEALEWEQSFLRELKDAPDITFGEFYDVYLKDREARLKASTTDTKDSIVQSKILPFFKDRVLRDITAVDIMTWQNKLLKIRNPKTGAPYSSDYLKTIHNQLSCIFNHGVRFYKLKENPARIAGNMAKSRKIEMKIWTEEEYKKFADIMMDEPLYYYCFEVLYWMGIRKGEMMALTREDIDLKKHLMRINKTLYTRRQIPIETTPKTEESNRVIVIPRFLCDELAEYFAMNYKLKPKDRLFPVNQACLSKRLIWGAKKAGLERIRVHDLRHSHVSLLIHKGFNAVQIAKRVGHSSTDITYRYAHLFPNAQLDMAELLDKTKAAIDNMPSEKKGETGDVCKE